MPNAAENNEKTEQSKGLVLTALDLHFLVEEMQMLVGAKVAQVYCRGKSDYFVQFHIPSVGKKVLIISLPGYFFLSDRKDKMPEKPTGMAPLLRTILGGSRLTEITQPGFERVVVMRFELPGHKGQNQHTLVAELFSKGNLVLCGNDFKVLASLHEQRLRNRPIRRGINYTLPTKRYNPITIGLEELKAALHESKRESVVKTLAIELSLGGKYAEQICEEASIEKSMKEPDAEGLARLHSALRQLITQKSFNDYSKAYAASYFARTDQHKSASSSLKYEKFEKIISIQEQQMAELSREIANNQEIAENIYSNYQEVSRLVDAVRKAQAKYSWQDAKKALKSEKKIVEFGQRPGKFTADV